MSQVFQSWRDENAVRNYPFSDAGPPTALSGETLPVGLVLDANIHPANVDGDYRLASVTVRDSRSMVFTVSGAAAPRAASGEWSSYLLDPSVIALTDTLGRPAGVLVVDPAIAEQLLNTWANRTVQFAAESSGFVVSTWNYTSATGELPRRDGVPVGLADDLYLVGEDGVRLTCDHSGETPVVRAHAIGDPLARLRDCNDEPVPRFIREVVFQQGTQTITCSPNALGEVFLVVASNFEVSSSLRLFSRPGEIQIGFSSPQLKPRSTNAAN
jgi:hypothetical protein